MKQEYTEKQAPRISDKELIELALTNLEFAQETKDNFIPALLAAVKKSKTENHGIGIAIREVLDELLGPVVDGPEFKPAIASIEGNVDSILKEIPGIGTALSWAASSITTKIEEWLPKIKNTNDLIDFILDMQKDNPTITSTIVNYYLSNIAEGLYDMRIMNYEKKLTEEIFKLKIKVNRANLGLNQGLQEIINIIAKTGLTLEQITNDITKVNMADIDNIKESLQDETFASLEKIINSLDNDYRPKILCCNEELREKHLYLKKLATIKKQIKSPDLKKPSKTTKGIFDLGIITCKTPIQVGKEATESAEIEPTYDIYELLSKNISKKDTKTITHAIKIAEEKYVSPRPTTVEPIEETTTEPPEPKSNPGVTEESDSPKVSDNIVTPEHTEETDAKQPESNPEVIEKTTPQEKENVAVAEPKRPSPQSKELIALKEKLGNTNKEIAKLSASKAEAETKVKSCEEEATNQSTGMVSYLPSKARTAAKNKLAVATKSYNNINKSLDLNKALKQKIKQKIAKIEKIEKIEAATNIQKIARGSSPRRKFTKQKEAATNIQKIARGYLQKKQEQQTEPMQPEESTASQKAAKQSMLHRLLIMLGLRKLPQEQKQEATQPRKSMLARFMTYMKSFIFGKKIQPENQTDQEINKGTTVNPDSTPTGSDSLASTAPPPQVHQGQAADKGDKAQASENTRVKL